MGNLLEHLVRSVLLSDCYGPVKSVGAKTVKLSG